MPEDKDRAEPNTGGHAPEAIATLLAGLALLGGIGGNPGEGTGGSSPRL